MGDSIRGLLVILIIGGCFLPGAAFAEEAKETASVEESVRLVGILYEGSTLRRLKDLKTEEVNHRFKVGHVSLIPTDLDLKPLLGKLVVVEGVDTAEYPWPAVVHEREERGFQARSDWRLDEDGKLEVVRGPAPPIHVLRPTKVSAVEGFSMEVVKEELKIVFENTLGAPLSALRFSLFYEGCYGKPGTTKKVEEIREMAVGGKKTLRFPILDMNERRTGIQRIHAAYTFRIDAKGEGIYFDAEISIPRAFLPDMDPPLKGPCRK